MFKRGSRLAYCTAIDLVLQSNSARMSGVFPHGVLEIRHEM